MRPRPWSTILIEAEGGLLKSSWWEQPRSVIGVSIGSIALSWLLFPDAATKWWSGTEQYYDTEHYARIALSGYDHGGSWAFAPLWPALLRAMAWVFGASDLGSITLLGGLAASGLAFLTCLTLIRYLPTVISDARARVFATYFFLLSPHAMFHFLSYTESLTSLLWVLLLAGIDSVDSVDSHPTSTTLHRLGLASLGCLLALARPTTLPLVASLVMAWGCVCLQDRSYARRHVDRIVAVGLGSILGLGLFCAYQYHVAGNPWVHFQSQAQWGRRLDLYWSLLVHPRSVGGSDKVLLWDLVAFWGPLILLGFVAYSGIMRRTLTTPARFGLWISIFFSLAQSAAAFLTYPIFMSTGRHVLGIPLFSIALGQALSGRIESQSLLRVGKLILLITWVYHVLWWRRFAQGSWTG